MGLKVEGSERAKYSQGCFKYEFLAVLCQRSAVASYFEFECCIPDYSLDTLDLLL